jgi:hypothetical protein
MKITYRFVGCARRSIPVVVVGWFRAHSVCRSTEHSTWCLRKGIEYETKPNEGSFNAQSLQKGKEHLNTPVVGGFHARRAKCCDKKFVSIYKITKK